MNHRTATPRLGALGALLLCAAPWISGCQLIHTARYRATADQGVESHLWREELNGARIGALIYTNAMNTMPEIEKALELDDPKASTVIYTQPDKGRRRSFAIWNTVSTILLGLTPSPWRTYANGAGWNPEQTLSGYELTFSSKDLNQAIFAGSEVAFKELGCAVSRFAPNNAAGIKLGKLAKANRDSIDFLWIVLHNYDLATNTRGEAMYRGELRGALIDSASAKTWLTYRRLVKSPTLQVASQTKIERGEGKPTLFRLSITPEEIVKTQKAIAEQVRKDLVEWPNKDAKKHAAQRPGISPLE